MIRSCVISLKIRNIIILSSWETADTRTGIRSRKSNIGLFKRKQTGYGWIVDHVGLPIYMITSTIPLMSQQLLLSQNGKILRYFMFTGMCALMIPTFGQITGRKAILSLSQEKNNTLFSVMRKFRFNPSVRPKSARCRHSPVACLAILMRPP